MIAGLYAPFYFAHFGIHFHDEPYQIALARDYTHSPGAPLSGLISTLWASVCGWKLYSMRALAIALNELGMLTCGAYMYAVTRRLPLTMLTVGITAYLMSFYFTTYLYGWDSASTCFICLTMTGTLCALRRPSVWIWVATGVCAGAAATSRIPNVCLWVLVPLLIAATPDMGHKPKYIGAYIAAALAVTSATIISIFGTPGAYAEAIRTEMVNAHSPLANIAGTLYQTLALFGTGSVVISVFALISLIYRIRLPRSIQAAAIAVVAIYFYGYSHIHMQEPDGLSLYFSAWLLITICYAAVCARGKTRPQVYMALITIACFSFAPTVGSNTALHKHLSIMAMPAALALTAAVCGRAFKTATIVTALVLGAFGIRNKCGFTYADAGIGMCTTEPATPLFDGVKTTPSRAALIDEIASSVHIAGDEDFMAVSNGGNRYLIDYLRGQRSPYRKNSWIGGELADHEYISTVCGHVRRSDRPVYILLLRYAEGRAKSSPMEDSLLTMHPQTVRDGDAYVLYRFGRVSERR